MTSVAPARLRRPTTTRAVAAPTEPDGRSAMRESLLVALTVAVALGALRVLFVAIAGLASRTSNEAAAAVALVIFSVPWLTPLVRRLGRTRAEVATVLGLAGWRVAAVVGDGIPFALAIAGGILGVLAVTLVVTSCRSGEVLVAGVLAGLATDVLARAAFATFDPVWQSTPPATAFALAVAAALAVLAVRVHRDSQTGSVQGGGGGGSAVGAGIGFGAALGLEVLFLLSPGFVASSAGVTLPAAVIVVLLGLAASAMAVAQIGPGHRRTLLAATTLVACGALLPVAKGPVVLLLVVAGHVAVAVVLAGAPMPRPVGLAAGWLVFAVGALLYQIHFDRPLPFDNRWITAALGLLTGLAALGPRAAAAHRVRPGTPLRTTWVARLALVGAAVVPFALTLTDDSSAVASAPTTLRVVEWNVRQGVTDDGQLDPEAIAQVLGRSGVPDVAVLVEAGRGWPMSGDLDLVAWLSRRLGMPYVWGGAADGQFGNVILSRLPLLASDVVALPVAGDAQGRSLVRAELELGGGERLTVLATHLQHRNDEGSMTARMAEIDEILDVWGGAPRTVLLGDFNPRQGDPPEYPPRVPGDFEEVRAILDAGLTTTQDLSACSAPTSNRNCSDYAFATPDLEQGPVEVVDADGSDHLPLFTTIVVGAAG